MTVFEISYLCSKNMHKILLYLSVSLFLACNQLPENVDEVLKLAGENQVELVKVLDHYKISDQKEEFEAALFLIGNMKDKYGLYFPEDSYYFDILNRVDSLRRQKKSVDFIDSFLEKIIDSIKSNNLYVSRVKIMDYNKVNADYLIENIDLAFKVWKEKPWAKHLNFEQFCEWILPYRIGNEPLQSWRKYMYNELMWVEDSIKKKDNPKEICMYVNKMIAKDFQYSDLLNFIPALGGIDQYKHKAGTCSHRYALLSMCMRSIGIPISIDFTPRSCKGDLVHDWTVLLDTGDSIHSFNGGEVWAELQNPPNCPLGGEIQVTSVFRNQFANNKNAISYDINEEEVPESFRNEYIRNVSDEYEGNKHGDIEINLNKDYNYKYAFLYVLNPGRAITPVAYAKTSGENVIFENIGRDGIYFVGFYDNQKVFLASPAFIYPIDGPIKYTKPDLSKTENIRIHRKFYVKYHMELFTKAMLGARLQGANKSSFSDAETLFTIDTIAHYFSEYTNTNTNKYQYYRYLSTETSDVRIAEISLFSENVKGGKTKIEGKVFGYKSDINSDDDAIFENAFDGSIRSNFNAPGGSWVAIDAGKRVNLTSFGFMARNNLNVVEPGDLYQLSYFDDGWKTIEQKIAENYYLDFQNVPKGAVLLLENKSKGKEECVFRWENGKQVFW